ncbi:MAG: hypothetical protein JST68_26670 [Bacteroidetes bacterium]|nr:hypothetical protein [Bacteroidota bacterium]
MSRQHYYSLFLLLGASLLLSMAFSPPFDLSVSDKEFFKYTGMAIMRGQVPYRDFFDHKPPLIYFINYAGYILGPWGLWLINTGLCLAVTFFFFRICTQFKLTFPWLLPLLFNLMIRDNMISVGANFTREYSTYFVMLFFITLMSKIRYRYFLLGLFTALTFFTQQDQVLLLVPFLLHAFLSKDTASYASRFIRMSAGFLSVTAPIIAYFALNHSLTYFWEDAYVFNFSIYIREKKTLAEHFKTIKRVLDGGNYEVPFMTAAALGLTALWTRHKQKALLLAALLSVILCMSSEWMGGRLEGTSESKDFVGYFLPLSATVCIVLFVVFAFTEEPWLLDRRLQLPYAALLIISLSYTALQHGANLPRRKDQSSLNRPELAYLKEQNLKDYQLYAFLDEDYALFYTTLKTLSPNRWAYQQFWLWYRTWDKDQKTLQSIADDLTRHHTTYLLMTPERITEMINPDCRTWWMNFVTSHYQPLAVPGGREGVLWKIKE